eukprot:CAMPEP_0116559748 /NCGR_PEP_ID=MMETSP0397-20121206/10581_1 /TAXON_ID=216820 /ORGANISM="Cyclophora tenuis, Strain ECT3854" /LENGTH=146 /DNA_ID=CAMNT_0004085577 /DNA_START=178 /DNA_END=618 /DNA_ORIENTATION=+
MTKEFLANDDGHVKALVTQDVEITSKGPKAIEGTEKEWPADLVVLSMGFVSPEEYIVHELGLDVDQRNNIHATYGDFRTNIEGVFAAGDCRRGQSLVVWAINEGRGCAAATDQYLQVKRSQSMLQQHSSNNNNTGFANLSSLSPRS